MIISGTPDMWTRGARVSTGFTGTDWIESIGGQLLCAVEHPEKHMTLDLSNIRFASLYEWITVVSVIERILTNPTVSYFNIDLIGTSLSQLLPPNKFISYSKGERDNTGSLEADYELSDRVYTLVGFLESVDTQYVLNHSEHKGKVVYPGIDIADINLRAFYSHKGGYPTLLFGCTRVGSKEDCREFLNEHRIRNWRNAMDERFRNSPIFESEEIWRVMCHEFAVNIWEHAGITGFLAGRVVLPFDHNNKILPWCRNTYNSTLKDLWGNMRHGFLELCIADAGNGFVNTLRESYLHHTGLNSTSNPRALDILTFAFDELGTCKSKEESWISERHALGRILHIVSKYGGALRLRTGGTEVIYASKGGRFKRRQGHLGFEPTYAQQLRSSIPGTQIQLILPLIPAVHLWKDSQRQSVLETYLPNSFHTEVNHVHGHLVPLLEHLDQAEACVDRGERLCFKKACEELCRKLALFRPRTEPLVLDFSGLNWPPAQFETLLYLLQNVIQNRPTLLVEISSELAESVIQLEIQYADTRLYEEITSGANSVTGRSFNEFSERYYLETYSRVHATVLGLDQDGRKYLFGLSDHDYELPLLSLIENHSSIDDLCNQTYWKKPLKESVLRAILNAVNPLFRVDENNKWKCVWGPLELANEASRVMSRHFDTLAHRTAAWRGRRYDASSGMPCGSTPSGLLKEPEMIGNKFNLPWQEEWREDFLEASRILSRERYVDEAAQRLIYRLKRGLESIHRPLEMVKVLACVTGPAMLLASAIHRWWPIDPRPVVMDLSYYVLLHQSSLPSIVKTGGIVIVQDVLEKQQVSGRLIERLRSQPDSESIDILCIISLIRLRSDISETRVTQFNEGWESKDKKDSQGFIPQHAMIEVCSPKICTPPSDEDEDDSKALWIEPRALLPISYKDLRRGRDHFSHPNLYRRDRVISMFDDPTTGCLFAAGHYVYGPRHYSVAINIRETLHGHLGEGIAYWLADLCEGKREPLGREWERPAGSVFRGDVTAVLMPLHSQIHYLWPRVADLLAKRSRRQPMWLLDATLFTGRGPAYRIPAQFRHQIEMAVQKAEIAMKSRNNRHPNPLRILILDDAIATARTAETILLTLNKEIGRAYGKYGVNFEKYPPSLRPVQWIRYFALLNQMGHAQHVLWKNLTTIGDPPIPFVIEEYAPFMGMQVYNESDCPSCRDLSRLEHLLFECERNNAYTAAQVVRNYQWELLPCAIDGPETPRHIPVAFSTGIYVLAPHLNTRPGDEVDIANYADTAIWRFYRLMYLSYPPSDVLLALSHAWSQPGISREEEKGEYERYRWAVLDWCLKNWPRIIANTARKHFIECIKKEIENNTPLVEKVLEGCYQHYLDHYIQEFVIDCIESLSKLELQRYNSEESFESDRIDRIRGLEIGLTLFFFNLPKDEIQIKNLDASSKKGVIFNLLTKMNSRACTLDSYGPSLLRNLYSRLTRPHRTANPSWALNAVAETLLRGRDPKDMPAGGHHLLPRLISDVLQHGPNDEDILLLESSLSVFMAALEDISPYANLVGILPDAEKIKDLGCDVLDWLKKQAVGEVSALEKPDALRYLHDALISNGDFINNFNGIFHGEVQELERFLQSRLTEKINNDKEMLDFKYEMEPNVKNCRVLTLVKSLEICLANLTIDPIIHYITTHKSHIRVFRISDDCRPDKIVFRLLTNFEVPAKVNDLIRQGRSSKAERVNLEMFGTEFDHEWIVPTPDEINAGFMAVFEIKVLSGFVTPRKENEF